MEEAFVSILCGQEYWSFSTNPAFFFRISFKEDGTGELWAVGELGWNLFFALNHTWKKVSRVDTSRTKSTADSRKPEVLGTLDIEITLTRTVARSWLTRRDPSRSTNEEIEDGVFHHPKTLLDPAFEPRTFTIAIEKGNFSHEEEYNWRCLYSPDRWTYRLTFDQPPYPPSEGYNHSEPGMERVENFGHLKVAVAGRLPKSAADVKPMDDDTFIGSIIGDVQAKARIRPPNSCIVS